MDMFSSRIRRVVEDLMGNEALAEGLETSAASALLDWGISLVRGIAASTENMDDEMAEIVMYPRLKATRKLMRYVSQWVSGKYHLSEGDRTFYWEKIVENAQVLYGERLAPSSHEHIQRMASELTAVEIINYLRDVLDKNSGGKNTDG